MGKCDLLLTGEGGPGSSSGTTAGWLLNAAENKEELLLRLRNPVVVTWDGIKSRIMCK